ncbi:hypothetical protein [Methylomonas koyamae]|uniref:hypothetical protein n=1 Tax=Methylomonas koyamae TaxID=702114 RepID=UPI0012F6DBFF|nr:hypothetical protein [Methylomonas koyamae]
MISEYIDSLVHSRGKLARIYGKYPIIKAYLRGLAVIRAKMPEMAGNINLSGRFA